jgi:DNA replication licensing factor MCM2
MPWIATPSAAGPLGGWPRHLRLTRREPLLALWLHEAPRDVLDVLREAATRHVLRAFPGYGAIRDEIHVRVADVPLQDSLRHLTRVHLDGLVRVAGVVTRRTGVFLLRLAYYDCIRCRGVCGPYSIDEGAAISGRGGRESVADLHQLSVCPRCNAEGPFKLNSGAGA